MKNRRYQEFVAKVVEALQAGLKGRWEIPWRRPGGVQRPRNVASGAVYRGLNVWSLVMAGFASPWWGTVKQWNDLGARVRKGERASYIWAPVWARPEPPEAADPEGEEAEAPPPKLVGFRAAAVFNAAQVEGWTRPDAEGPEPQGPEPVAVAEAYFAAVGARAREGTRAFYRPGEDVIVLPPRAWFRDGLDYEATRAHEHVHWTGAQHRLAREFGRQFGDRAYAMEELVAEIGAGLLLADLGLASPEQPREDHLLYLQEWVALLENRPRALWTAAAKAEMAVRYLHHAAREGGFTGQLEGEEEVPPSAHTSPASA